MAQQDGQVMLRRWWMAAAAASLLLLLAPLGSDATAFGTVGKCRHGDLAANAPDFNLDQYVRGFAGRWDFRAVAATPDNAALVWAYLRNAAGDDGLFYTQIYGQQEGEDLKHYVNETSSLDANGVVTVTPVGTSSVNIKVLFPCYKNGKFGYYLACSDDSAYDIDTRFLITYEGYRLDQSDLSCVSAADRRHRFRGDMKTLQTTTTTTNN